MRYIVYPNNGSLALVIPTGELSIEEVARKDVPAGSPYKFVTSDQLPDNDFFDAWEADFSSPDGHGIGAEAWFAEQEASK
jgi:homogentisate 1,2-dioxygenase